MSAAGSSGRLSSLQGAALTTGAVLGTGVISLPALAAGVAGPASLLAWLALVLLSVPLAATFAALGARYPDSGGVSTYARRAFGTRVGAMVGWVFYFAIPIGAPPAAGFAGAYVADTFGGGRATQVGTVVVLTLLVGLMNWFGIRISGKVQLLLAGVLAAVLVVTVVAALPGARLSNLTPFAPHGWSGIGAAAALLIWAFAGWEAVSSLSSEYRNPRRDIPRATAIAIAVVGTLYLVVAAAAVLVLGPAAGDSAAPLADLLAVGLGGPARTVTTVLAVLLTVGAMNAYFAGGAKLGAALGRDGAFPAWFARGSVAGEVPRRSLTVVVALCLVSLLVAAVSEMDLAGSVLLATGSFTLVYVIGTASAIRLLPAGWARRGAIVSFVCVSAVLWLTGRHVLWALGVATVACVYGWVAAGVRKRRTSRATPARPGPIDCGCAIP
jgi:amino acid efflux transporter